MIIGTAGHIDHGKTALVRALTGVDTDRLKEEKARGISIDLGFAYMPAGEGETLGYIDAPGHERFVHTMLAGASGMDFVLLAIAADDGVMPQTRRASRHRRSPRRRARLRGAHQEDLVDDTRRSEVSAEIARALRGTTLEDAPILPVSTVTGEGVAALRTHLVEASRDIGNRAASGRFRLAVDRCFTIAGAGTIVTGTVFSGCVAVGDHVVVSPSGLRARVRSIRAQDAPAEFGRAGDRCGINLAGDGVGKDAISRGDMVLDLNSPRARRPYRRILARARRRAEKHWPVVPRAPAPWLAGNRRAHRSTRRSHQPRSLGARAAGAGKAHRRRGRRPLCGAGHFSPADDWRRRVPRFARPEPQAPNPGETRPTRRSGLGRARPRGGGAAGNSSFLLRPHTFLPRPGSRFHRGWRACRAAWACPDHDRRDSACRWRRALGVVQAHAPVAP